MEPLCYSVYEAAALLGLSRQHTYEMIELGLIPSIRFGKRILVPRKALQEMIEGPQVASTDQPRNTLTH